MALTFLLLILAAWLFVRTWWGHLPHLIADKAGL
jgi:hypothetical protein